MIVSNCEKEYTKDDFRGNDKKVKGYYLVNTREVLGGTLDKPYLLLYGDAIGRKLIPIYSYNNEAEAEHDLDIITGQNSNNNELFLSRDNPRLEPLDLNKLETALMNNNIEAVYDTQERKRIEFFFNAHGIFLRGNAKAKGFKLSSFNKKVGPTIEIMETITGVKGRYINTRIYETHFKMKEKYGI